MLTKHRTLFFITTILLVISNTVISETLEIAIFKTIANHPEIKAEINRKSARQHELSQAKSGYYPTVDLLAAVGSENSKNRFTIATGATDYVDLTRKEEAFVVTYNLFKGFDTSNNVEKNSAKVKSAGHRLHDLTEQTALQVANVYLRVLRYQQLVKLSEDTLNVHLKLFEKVKSRSLSGVAKRSDINQAMGRVSRARANLIADKTSLKNAEYNYLRIIGEMPTELLKPKGLDNKIPADLEQAITLAVDSNPLLKAAHSDVDVANAQRRQSKSDFYPRFDLVFEQSRGENLDGITGVENDYSLMLKMRYNLFNGGFDLARSRQAFSQYNESKDKLHDIRRSIHELMHLSWNSYQSVKTQIPYLFEHVKSIKATRKAYSDQFKIGKRTLLDLLDSENELYQANRSYITAEYDRLLSGYRILANIGKFVDAYEDSTIKM